MESGATRTRTGVQVGSRHMQGEDLTTEPSTGPRKYFLKWWEESLFLCFFHSGRLSPGRIKSDTWLSGSCSASFRFCQAGSVGAPVQPGGPWCFWLQCYEGHLVCNNQGYSVSYAPGQGPVCAVQGPQALLWVDALTLVCGPALDMRSSICLCISLKQWQWKYDRQTLCRWQNSVWILGRTKSNKTNGRFLLGGI